MSSACPPSIPAVLFDRALLLTVPRVCYSLCLAPEYDGFRSKLERWLPLPDGPTLPTTGDGAIDAVLKVLHTERERKKADEEQAGEEDCDEMDNSIGASATDKDEDMMDEPGQPQTPVDEVDNALKILVRSTTEEFGFAPRDVYDGVFNLPKTEGRHATVIAELNYLKLKALVDTFSNGPQLSGSSHRVVAVSPLHFSVDYHTWEVTFKSNRIAKRVVERMEFKEVKDLQELYNC